MFTGNFDPTGSIRPVPDPSTFTADDARSRPGPSGPDEHRPGARSSKPPSGQGPPDPDAPLTDGRPTYDASTRQVTATPNLSDPTPRRAAGGLQPPLPHAAAQPPAHNTTAAATPPSSSAARLRRVHLRRPVPARHLFDGFVLWVAPDWKIARRSPSRTEVRDQRPAARQQVGADEGQLRALPAARRARVDHGRLEGARRRAAMTFTVKVSRSTYAGKTVRFLYSRRTTTTSIGSGSRSGRRRRSAALADRLRRGDAASARCTARTRTGS